MTKTVKRCGKCNLGKPVADFNRCKTKADGLQSYCRDCIRSYIKVYRQNLKLGVADPASFDMTAQIGYSAAHKRVVMCFGPAKLRDCTHCGVQACDWAYTHDCPLELTGPTRCVDRVLEVRYSADPTRYIPLCKPCHIKFDRHDVRH